MSVSAQHHPAVSRAALMKSAHCEMHRMLHVQIITCSCMYAVGSAAAQGHLSCLNCIGQQMLIACWVTCRLAGCCTLSRCSPHDVQCQAAMPCCCIVTASIEYGVQCWLSQRSSMALQLDAAHHVQHMVWICKLRGAHPPGGDACHATCHTCGTHCTVLSKQGCSLQCCTNTCAAMHAWLNLL